MKAWFEQRHPREQKLLIAGAALLITAFVWFLAIAPALQTYRTSSAAHTKLDAELAQMQAMAQEAKKLKERPALSAAAAQTWLETAVKKLGTASVSVQGVQGGRAQVTFAGASPEALAQWLTEARTAAQLPVVQANWKRNTTAKMAPTKTADAKTVDSKSADLRWDGSMLLELPSK